MSEIWEEHKQFLLGLGAAFIVFLIASGMIGSKYLDASEQIGGKSRKLVSNLAKIPDAARAIPKLKRVKEGMEDEISGLTTRLQVSRGDEFVLPRGSRDADIRYNRVAQRVREEVVDQAATLDIIVDRSLGLPEFSPSSRSEIVGYLAGLAVVEKVCLVAIEEEVDSIAPIRILSGTVSRFDRGESFLEKVTIEMRLTGVSDAVLSVIARLQKGDSYVPMGESSLVLNDDERGLVTADLVLYAVVVNPTRPVSLSKKKRRRS